MMRWSTVKHSFDTDVLIDSGPMNLLAFTESYSNLKCHSDQDRYVNLRLRTPQLGHHSSDNL
jgi:hypothetical protein